MGLYFRETEITKLRNLVPQTGLDITGLWFGETNIYTVWGTYEGTLPATLNANGSDFRQYQIYGATGGVGDRTEMEEPAGYKIPIATEKPGSLSKNLEAATVTPIYIGDDLLDKDEYVDYQEGKIYRRTAQLFNKNTVTFGSFISLNGEVRNTKYHCSDFIPVSAGSYYLKNVVGVRVQNTTVVYDANKRALRYANINGSYVTKGVITFTDGDAYIRVNIDSSMNPDTVDIIVGSTEPTEHIPYISPVDPPVPLPALPTCEETIVDYAGQSVAPEKVFLKYRKEGY